MRAFTVEDRLPRPRALTLALVAVFAAAGCAGSAPPQVAGEPRPTTPEAAAPEATADAAEAAAADEGDDPEELSEAIHFDDQDQAYRRLRIPKEEGRYKRVGEDRIQIPYGLLFYVAEETEEAFYVKLFVPPEELEEAEIPAPPVRWEAEAAIALVAPQAVDRLRLEPFDRGLPDRGQWRQGFDVADLDGDGNLDIAHGPPRKGVSVPHIFLGNGEGDWRLWREVAFRGADLDYGDAEVADFNGDGIADLAFAVHLRGLAVFVGDGQGGFELWSQGLEFASPRAHQGTASFSSRALTSLDWNGDGRTDLLALGEGPSLGRPSGPSPASPAFQSGARGPALFLNQGDGTWQRAAFASAERPPFGDALATGDFDGDGKLDVATATNGYGALDIVYLGQSDGGWRPVAVEALGSSTLVRSIAAADLDGDGRDELAAGTLTAVEGEGFISAVEVFDLQPDGGWRRETVESIKSQLGVWGLAAGDVDGDGRPDLVAATGAGEVWVFLGSRDGFRRERTEELVPPGYLCRGYHVALVDLDGEPGDEMIVAFAGEPGSEQMIPGLEARCPEEGALQVWKAVPRR